MGVKAAGEFRCKLLCSRRACQRHACIRLPKERSIGSAAGWFRCPLPKEGTAAPAATARTRRVSCLRDGPSGNTPGACGDVGSLPAHCPCCFPWRSVRIPAFARLCHPLAPRPWRSYSPSLCLGSPTCPKPPQDRWGKGAMC